MSRKLCEILTWVLMSVISAEAFYDASVETHNVIKNLKTDYGATGAGVTNESALLQQAIDDVAAVSGGGDVIIPQGDYLFRKIALKSDVHIRVEAGTTITHYSIDTNRNSSVFGIGGGIENVSLRGIPAAGSTNDRFRIVLNNDTKAPKAMGVGHVSNFLISNIDIQDDFTTHSCINFTSSGTDWTTGGYATNGTVCNLTAYDCHFGYGLIQAHAGVNVLFTNLHGVGGLTLRLETGALDMNERQFGGVHNIVGRDISCLNGHGAVMMGPHNMQNGVVQINGVRVVSCGSGASIGAAETLDGKDVTNPDIRPGKFSPGTYIHDVEVVFGTNAMLKSQQVAALPPELKHLVTTNSPDGGKSVYGPSLLATSMASGYGYSISGVRAYGFDYVPPVKSGASGDGFTEDPFLQNHTNSASSGG